MIRFSKVARITAEKLPNTAPTRTVIEKLLNDLTYLESLPRHSITFPVSSVNKEGGRIIQMERAGVCLLSGHRGEDLPL